MKWTKEKQKEYNKKYQKIHKKELLIYEFIRRNKPDRKKYNKEYNKKYRQEHKEYYLQYRKDYYQKYKKEIDRKNKKYRQNHKEEVSINKKEYYQEHKEKLINKSRNRYKFNSKKICKKQYIYKKQKLIEDKNFLIINRLRERLRIAFKNYGNGKNKTSKRYGIDFYKIIEHLKPFPEDLSRYHIHHIKPLCSFYFINEDGSENLEQIKEAFKPENHQWLLAEENLKKGGRF